MFYYYLLKLEEEGQVSPLELQTFKEKLSLLAHG